MKFKYESKKSLRAKLTAAEKSLREARGLGLFGAGIEMPVSRIVNIANATSPLRDDIKGLIDLGVIPERYRASLAGRWITPPLLDSKKIRADLDAIKVAEQVKRGEMLLKERGEKEPF